MAKINLGMNDFDGADAKSRWEPQRQNNGIVRFTDFNFGKSDGSGNAAGKSAENLFELALVSWPFPKSTTNVTELDYMNEKRKFAGRTTYDDVPIVLVDYCNKDVVKLLQSWRYAVIDPSTGAAGFAGNYKKDGVMIWYAPDGTLERQWEIKGAWPSAFDAGDADMSADDFVRITLTLTIDKCIPSTNVKPGNASK